MGDLSVGQSAADDVYVSGLVAVSGINLSGSFAITTTPLPVSGVNLAGSFAVTTVPLPITPYLGSGLPIIQESDIRVITWKGTNTALLPTEGTTQFRTVWEFTTPSGVTWRPMGMYVLSTVAGFSFRLAERITMWRSKWGAIGSPGAVTYTVSEGSPGLPVGSYYYSLTACTNAGESLPSNSSVVIITPGSQRVRITSPTQASGVCWWKAYRTAVDAAQGNEAFIDSFPCYAAVTSLYDDVHPDADRITTNTPPVADTTAREIDCSGTNNTEVSEVSCVFNEGFPISQKIRFYYTDQANRKQCYEHDPGNAVTLGEGFDLLINRDANASSDQVAFPRPSAIEAPYTGSAKTYQHLFIRDLVNVETTPAPTGAAFNVYGFRPILHSDVEVLNVGTWQRPVMETNIAGGTELVLQTAGTTSAIHMFVEIVFRQV